MRSLNLLQLVEKQEELNDLYVPGWRAVLSPAHYFCQCIDEASEFFGSGIEYKWWKDVDQSKYDEWNAKIEVTDILFFSASIISLSTHNSHAARDFMASTKLESHHDADEASFIKKGTNKLNHDAVGRTFADLSKLAFTFNSPVTTPIVSLVSRIVGSMNFSPEELSAMYCAKYALNKFRISSDYKSGRYLKVVDGVEDNQRLKAVVDRFLANEEMTLADVEEEVTSMFFVSSSK